MGEVADKLAALRAIADELTEQLDDDSRLADFWFTDGTGDKAGIGIDEPGLGLLWLVVVTSAGVSASVSLPIETFLEMADRAKVECADYLERLGKK